MSVNFYKTTWCNIPEDSHLHCKTGWDGLDKKLGDRKLNTHRPAVGMQISSKTWKEICLHELTDMNWPQMVSGSPPLMVPTVLNRMVPQLQLIRQNAVKERKKQSFNRAAYCVAHK
jgi:hypothetical protein